jgi:hypothetical protein
MGPHETIGSISCIFQWAKTKLSTAPVEKIMGPCKATGNSSCICQWAQTRLLAAPVVKLMGPFEGIDSSSSSICRWAHAKLSTSAGAYASGPTRNYRQRQQHMPMGPHETIGSSSCMRQWAQTKLSTAPVGKIMGLYTKASAAAAAYANGPKRGCRQHLSGE